jgi:hypothetical protein
MNTVVSTKLYGINTSEKEIKISMTLGHGQQASSSVRLNGVILKDAILNDFQDFTIGKNKDLNNGLLIVDITVKDVNPQTDLTSVNLTLSGGKSPHTQQFTETADKNGGAVHYHLSYFLKK